MSRSSWDHRLNKLGRPTSPVLHTKSKGHWPSGSGEEVLKGFYHIWAWRPSLSCDQNILYKFWLTYHEESSFM